MTSPWLTERHGYDPSSRKVSNALVEEAVDSLAQAKAMHDELEAIYNPYVDFERVHAMADWAAGELLGE